jgi:hypothetical protein
MNNWHEEIKVHESFLEPAARWIIVGYYEDEVADYKTAEAAWELRQQQGWKTGPCNSPEDDARSLQELAKCDYSLDIIDDYFHWNVETPHWYLHNDGVWEKSLAKIREFSNMSGRYTSREAAEEALKNCMHIPQRFENYVEHLNNARPPISCKK